MLEFISLRTYYNFDQNAYVAIGEAPCYLEAPNPQEFICAGPSLHDDKAFNQFIFQLMQLQ